MASIQITHRGSYEHYKTRTKVFINWLTEAAHKCCKLDDVVLALKGRAGKNARKNGEEVLLTTREITILCQKIAEKKSFKIPDWILALLRTIIAKRTEYAAFYSELSAAGGSAFDRSNAGHTHFIDVLQQAYDIFAAVDHSRIAIHVTPAIPCSSSSKASANSFENLDVETPAESELDEQELEQRTADVPRVNFRVEVDDRQEDLVQLVCVLADMKEVREEVEATFEQYVHGEVTGEFACMVADTGFGIIRRACERFVDHRPRFRDFFETLTSLGLESGRNENLVFVFPTGKSSQANPATLAAVQRVKPLPLVCSEISSLLCPTGAVMMFDLYNDLMGIKHGARPGYNPPNRHGFDQILHNAVPELQELALREELLEPMLGFWNGDEFLSGLLNFAFSDQQCLPIWLAVITQCYRNIYNILGGHMTCGAETNARRWAALKKKIQSFRGFEYCKGQTYNFRPEPSWSKWFEHVMSKNLSGPLDMVVDVEDDLKVPIPKDVSSGAPTYLVANLPTAAGGLMMEPILMSYLDECQIANIHLVVHCAAHLYAACESAGLVEEDLRWRDMEFFLEHHKMYTKTVSEADPFTMVSHFHLALGIQGCSLAKAKTAPFDFDMKKVRPIKGTSVMVNEYLKIFRNSCNSGRNALDINNKEVLVEVLARADCSQPDMRGKSCKPQQKAYSPISLLATFKRHLIKNEPKLNFNMIGFFQQCSLFVEEARKQTGRSTGHDMSEFSPHAVTNLILAQSANLLHVGKPVSHTLLPVIWKALGDAIAGPRDAYSRDAWERSSGHLSPNNKPNMPPKQDPPTTDRLFNAFVHECLSRSRNWVPEDNKPNATIFQLAGGPADRSPIIAMYKKLQRWERTYKSNNSEKQLTKGIAALTEEMRAWAQAGFDDSAMPAGLVDIMAKSLVVNGDTGEGARQWLNTIVKDGFFVIDLA